MTSDPRDILEIRDAEIAAEPLFKTIQANMAQRPPITLPSLTQFKRDVNKPANPTSSSLNRLLIQLMATRPLQETQFTSTIPIIGPLLIMIRRAWNWMSTKWYVLPLVHQQAAINAQLITLINEMVAWQEIQTDTISQLQAKVEHLEDQLAHAEDK